MLKSKVMKAPSGVQPLAFPRMLPYAQASAHGLKLEFPECSICKRSKVTVDTAYVVMHLPMRTESTLSKDTQNLCSSPKALCVSPLERCTTLLKTEERLGLQEQGCKDFGYSNVWDPTSSSTTHRLHSLGQDPT